MSDENDVDALLNELTNPPESPKKPSTSQELESIGERVGSFKIDPKDSYITGVDQLRRRTDALGVNPNDFTNQVDLAEENKRRRGLYITLGVLSFLLVLGAVAFMVIPRGAVTPTIPTDDTSAQRFLSLYPEAPGVQGNTTMEAQADKNGLKILGAYRLTFPGMEFKDLGYRATASSDFGPTAQAQVKGEWNGTTVYLFKDMAHTKAFANAWEGEPVTVEGSPAAAVMYMELASGVHAVLSIVNPDSSGFMIVLPTNLNWETAQALAKNVRVENANLVENFEALCNPEYDVPILSVPGSGAVDLGDKSDIVMVSNEIGSYTGMRLESGEKVEIQASVSDGSLAIYPLNDFTYKLFKSKGGPLENVSGGLEKRYQGEIEDKKSGALYRQFTECLALLPKS